MLDICMPCRVSSSHLTNFPILS
uniref:Uncharacterized protein n=1 Tax=Arundo donax TaxID=35708 RepID=A0A0A9APJ8_ARUDO